MDRYPEIRDLQLLIALSQRKHFTRAAADCDISQPAFSARIHHLEQQLGVPIVHRGNKFLGFTKEGELVIKWARKVIADVEGMRQEVDSANSDLRGVLAVGVVPTALPYAASISTVLRSHHEHLTVKIQSLSSTEITHALQESVIDAGISYESDSTGFSFDSIYQEHYVLLSPQHMAPRTEGYASWSEAATLPLCLLSKDMRFRQIVDEVFQLADVKPEPVMETNAFTAAMVQVNEGSAATIAPQKLVDSMLLNQNSVCLRLNEPTIEKSIGLMTIDHELTLPAINALRKVINLSVVEEK